jgi:hypothetical protein
MKQIFETTICHKAFSTIGCLIAIAFVCFGCATPEKSNFLTGDEPMQHGKYVNSYWSAGEIDKQIFSKIYIEPIDVSRIKNYPEVPTMVASNELRQAIAFAIRARTSWQTVEQPDLASAKISLAITYLTPGSAAGRMWAAELGAGHAIVQVDGKVSDVTGKEIASFEDRQRDSGAIGFEDLGGDAGPRMVKRMLESISLNFVKELSESAK